MFIPGDAWGAPQHQCGKRDQVIKVLVEKFREFPIYIEKFGAFERAIYQQPVTGYYHVIIYGTGKDDIACVIRAGTSRFVRERSA